MSKASSKFSIQKPKPRNPLVAASLFRRAGAHVATVAAARQQARRSLQRELDSMRSFSP